MTNQEAGKQATNNSRRKILAEAKRCGLTLHRTLMAISDALDAEVTKASYDKEAGKWAYSQNLIDHLTRLKAAELAVMLLDLKPAEKHEVDLSGGGIIVEVVNYAKGKDAT